MDDEFPIDEPQPPEITDRAASRAQSRRRAEVPTRSRRAAIPSRPTASEPDSAKPARALLEEILEKMGVSHVEITYVPRSEGEYFEITGPELATLIGRHGNTLEALNLVFNNILNVGVRNNRKYYTIDAEGYRARRADQLKNLALVTLERCIREKKPQPLEPMLPSERKIIHLALAENEYVRTESEGVEPERHVVIFPR
jgi:spoIIIJ-associated protein